MQKDHNSDDALTNGNMHHTADDFLRRTKLSDAIDRNIERIGEIFGWLWLILLIVIIANVILRYAFSQGMIELEELQWYLYAAAWLFGLSYTFICDGHVRVDVVHDQLSIKTRVVLEFLGLVILFLPFVLFVVSYAIPFVELSWQTNETSTSANGLPARWLIKGCLLVSFILLLLVGISRLIRVLATLRYGAIKPEEQARND